ncbi:MAG TPA: BON domain-containing protein [Acidobacteriota bacterium]|jgi:hyperosmotically inducible protein
MKTWILSGILVLCLAIGFMAGCNENNSRAEQKDNPTQVGSTKDTRSDTSITAELKGKITDSDLLDNTDISVDTDHNVVTLSGSVATAEQKAHAEELAKNTTGVLSVNNKLAINPEKSKGITGNAGEKTKEGYNETKGALSNARITSEVKLKFAADDTVKALNIDVDTDNGVVTLNGSVNSKAELQKAIQLAKSVDGVHHVKSNLTIAKQ